MSHSQPTALDILRSALSALLTGRYMMTGVGVVRWVRLSPASTNIRGIFFLLSLSPSSVGPPCRAELLISPMANLPEPDSCPSLIPTPTSAAAAACRIHASDPVLFC